jgi:hypothetical protein
MLLGSTPRRLTMAGTKISGVAISEIRADIMTNAKTTLATFIALCDYYEFSAIIVSRSTKTYLEYNPDTSRDDLPIHIILRDGGGGYSLDIGNSVEYIESIRTAYVKLESHLKAFRPQTFYKINDLIIISDKLGLSTKDGNTLTKSGIERSLKKGELYDVIVDKCTWRIGSRST